MFQRRRERVRGETGPDSGVRTQRRTLERRTLGPNTHRNFRNFRFENLQRLRPSPDAASAGLMDREESRYAHLLAPIRDLAQNWHTDIAAELSDYLSQLEEITFTFDGGNTNLNFAEGACKSSSREAAVLECVLDKCPSHRVGLQPRCLSRAARACTPARWSTSTSWCSTPWRLWPRSGAQEGGNTLDAELSCAELTSAAQRGLPTAQTRRERAECQRS